MTYLNIFGKNCIFCLKLNGNWAIVISWSKFEWSINDVVDDALEEVKNRFGSFNIVLNVANCIKGTISIKSNVAFGVNPILIKEA